MPRSALPKDRLTVVALGLASLMLVQCERGPDGRVSEAGEPSPVSDAVASPRIPRAEIVPTGPEPLSPDLSFILQMIEAEQTGPARVRLRNFRQQHPEDGKAAFLFGLTYHREKRYHKACEYFDEAIRLEPEYPLTYYFKAWALYYLGELDAAVALFETHLAYQPDEADSHFGIGLVELENDRLDGAELRFRRALELLAGRQGLERERSKAYARLADVLMRRGQWSEARPALEEAVQLYPDHYEAHFKLYRVLVRLGDDDAAQQALQAHLAAKERVRPGTAFPE